MHLVETGGHLAVGFEPGGFEPRGVRFSHPGTNFDATRNRLPGPGHQLDQAAAFYVRGNEPRAASTTLGDHWLVQIPVVVDDIAAQDSTEHLGALQIVKFASLRVAVDDRDIGTEPGS
jgi:hypothetical protein